MLLPELGKSLKINPNASEKREKTRPNTRAKDIGWAVQAKPAPLPVVRRLAAPLSVPKAPKRR